MSQAEDQKVSVGRQKMCVYEQLSPFDIYGNEDYTLKINGSTQGQLSEVPISLFHCSG